MHTAVNKALVAFVVSSLVVLLCAPLLDRSTWGDEVMLLLNTPLGSMLDAWHPLPFYDQAGTPAFTLVLSLFSSMDIALMRACCMFLVVFCLVFSMVSAVPRLSALNVLIGLLVLMILSNALVMYSEFKHYGLEAAGMAVLISWYITRRGEKALGPGDVLLVLVGLSLGISTVVVAGLVVCVFFIERYRSSVKINALEWVLFAALGFCIGLHFLNIQHITEIQVSNYSSAYQNLGVIENLRKFVRALWRFLELPGVLALATFSVILLISSNSARVQRFLVLCALSLLCFSVLVASGHYPATSARHVTWMAGFTTFLVYLAITSLPKDRTMLNVISGLLLVSFSAAGTYAVYTNNHEHTENSKAIQYLAELEPTKIGYWIGGQPVVHLYQRYNPELVKHEYFGDINARSVRVNTQTSSPIASVPEFNDAKSEPGGWGKLVQFNSDKDFEIPAQSLIEAAPKNEDFYIFATHYILDTTREPGLSRVQGLHKALDSNNCDFNIASSFEKAAIYKVHCKSA